MKEIPESVIVAWGEREPILVLSTVDGSGVPNSVYVGVTGHYEREIFFVMNSSFQKTEANILEGSKASLLFLTREKKAYQMKGEIRLEFDGPVFEAMMAVKPEQYLAKSVAVLRVEEVYSGAERLM